MRLLAVVSICVQNRKLENDLLFIFFIFSLKEIWKNNLLFQFFQLSFDLKKTNELSFYHTLLCLSSKFTDKNYCGVKFSCRSGSSLMTPVTLDI